MSHASDLSNQEQLAPIIGWWYFSPLRMDIERGLTTCVEGSSAPSSFGVFYLWGGPETATGQEPGHHPPTNEVSLSLVSWQHVRATATMANPPHKKRDRSKENFAKSCKSGAARFNKLNQKYHARIYLQVQWRGRYYEYHSDTDLRWLKIGEELEAIYPLPVQWTPATFMKGNDDSSTSSPPAECSNDSGRDTEGAG
jgi:hypothetical protein